MPRLPTLRGRVATLDTRAAKPPPKEPDPHYLTKEHRQWRAEVLRRAGYSCEKCGARGVKLYADHITELKDGGDPLGPGQALCHSCHGKKTNTERAKRMAVQYK